MPDLDTAFRCQVCGEWRYTPSMAKQCERSHAIENR